VEREGVRATRRVKRRSRRRNKKWRWLGIGAMVATRTRATAVTQMGAMRGVVGRRAAVATQVEATTATTTAIPTMRRVIGRMVAVAERARLKAVTASPLYPYRTLSRRSYEPLNASASPSSTAGEGGGQWPLPRQRMTDFLCCISSRGSSMSKASQHPPLACSVPDRMGATVEQFIEEKEQSCRHARIAKIVASLVAASRFTRAARQAKVAAGDLVSQVPLDELVALHKQVLGEARQVCLGTGRMEPSIITGL
jgi:hypothetical protein